MAAVVRGKVIRDDVALWDGGTKTYSRPDATGGTTTGLTVGDFVDVLQVYGAGANRTAATIAAAVARIGSSNVTLLFATGTWTIDANTTVPANFTCIIPAGCVFSINSGITLTLAGNCVIEHTTFFSGSGSIVLTNPRNYNSNSVADSGLEVWRDDGVLQANIQVTGYNLDGGGTLHMRHARGTRSAATASQSGDIVGGIGARVCYDSSGNFQTSSPAAIHWAVTENQSSTAYGMEMRFLSTPKTSTTRQRRGVVADNGVLMFHDTATYSTSTSAVTQPHQDVRILASATSTSGATGVSHASAAYGTGVTPGFRGLHSRGTSASQTASQADDMLAFLAGHGYGTSWTTSANALIAMHAAENMGGSALGTYIAFSTTPTSSTTRAEVMRLTDDGFLGIGTTTPQKQFVVSNGGEEGIELSPGESAGRTKLLAYNRDTSAYVALDIEALSYTILGLADYANDAAAQAAGVPVNGLYRNGSVVMVRVA